MAASSYTLCRSQANHDSFTNPAGTSGRILGSTSGSTNVEVLVTVQGDGVVVYHSSKQQRTKSWPLGSRGTTFAAPAIWDRQSGRYYAALASPSGEQQLVSWEKGAETSQSLSEAPAKAAFTGPVHSLWPVSRRKVGSGGLASGAVVVLQDGALVAFSGDLAETCRLHAGVKNAAVEAIATSCEDGALLLAISLVERTSGGSLRRVQIVELATKVGGPEEKGDNFKVRQQVELRQEGEGAALSVASVALGENLDLSVLWSNGRWQSFTVDWKEGCLGRLGHERSLAVFQLVAEESQGKAKKTQKKKRAAREEITVVDTGQLGRLVAIPGTSYVAAVGPGSTAGGLVGVVLDSRYGCLHKQFAVTADREATDTEAKADSLSSLLGSGPQPVVDLQTGGEDGLLLVSTPAEVIVCDVPLAPLSLAGMLGALSQAPGKTRGAQGPMMADGEDGPILGWGGMADQAAAAASVVYGQLGSESLRVPASGVVLSPSIRGREGSAEESELVCREEDGVWAVEVLQSKGRSEEELLRRIRGAESEQELVTVLVEHLGGERRGGDGHPPGANGLLNGVHANGRDDSDDSDMEDALPNGGLHQNGAGGKLGEKKGEDKAEGTGRQLSKLFRQSSSQLVAAVVKQSLCLEAWSTLESALWLGTLPPGTDCHLLVRALASGQQLQLLEKVIAHLRDLPPSDLAFLLRFLIGDASDAGLRKVAVVRKERAAAKLTKLAGAVKEGQVSRARRREVTAVKLVVDAVDLFTPRESALHQLVAVPRDETVLAAALRELTAAEVTFLVSYFAKWMDVYFDRSELSAPKWGSVVLPSLAQVVLWLSLLFDVHLTRLALLPDCHQVVSRLHKVVAAQVVLTRKLVPLGGVTDHIQRKAKLPIKKAPSGKPAGTYSVEVVSL